MRFVTTLTREEALQLVGFKWALVEPPNQESFWIRYRPRSNRWLRAIIVEWNLRVGLYELNENDRIHNMNVVEGSATDYVPLDWGNSSRVADLSFVLEVGSFIVNTPPKPKGLRLSKFNKWVQEIEGTKHVFAEKQVLEERQITGSGTGVPTRIDDINRQTAEWSRLHINVEGLRPSNRTISGVNQSRPTQFDAYSWVLDPE